MDKKNIILVSSFPRSGTHFMIDSLRLNIPEAVFPVVKHWPSDFNYGALFRDSKEVNRFFEKQFNRNRWTIIKSHLLPSESRIVANRENISEETRNLIRRIWDQSIKLYMYRDPRDVLISYYHLNNSNMGFSDFIHSPNLLDKFHMRKVYGCDANKVLFWREHVEQWLDVHDVHYVKYEKLRDSYDGVIKVVLETHLKTEMPNVLCRPKKDNYASIWAKLKNILRKAGVGSVPVDSTNYVGSSRKGGWSVYYTEKEKELLVEVTASISNKLGYDMSSWEDKSEIVL